jgi:hypothetical protein
MTTLDQDEVKQPASTARIWGLPKNVLFLGFVSLLTDLSSEVAIRTLPLFLANVLGIKTSIIGLVEGFADSTATLTRLLSGWLSDQLGKRKVLVAAGYGLSTFVKPVLYFATSWWQILIVRFLDRVVEFDLPRFTKKYRAAFIYEVDLTDTNFFRNRPRAKIFENLFFAVQDAKDPGKFRILFGENTHILSREDNLSSGSLPTINRSLAGEGLVRPSSWKSTAALTASERNSA